MGESTELLLKGKTLYSWPPL